MIARRVLQVPTRRPDRIDDAHHRAAACRQQAPVEPQLVAFDRVRARDGDAIRR
jgi:hypothetical protein